MPTQKTSPDNLSIADIHEKGWSLRTAAVRLGVHWTHLHKVIRSERTSKALTEKIKKLPVRGESLISK